MMCWLFVMLLGLIEMIALEIIYMELVTLTNKDLLLIMILPN